MMESIESKNCSRCKEIVYGSREREADGYRTWWYPHQCVIKTKERYRFVSNQWVKL